MKIFACLATVILTVLTVSCGGGASKPLHAEDGRKPKQLWMDAEANYARFASQDSIRYYLDRTVEAGFNEIVVDVRPTEGDVLYKSDFMTPATTLKERTVTRDWDYLQFFIDEARLRNLRVTVSTTIFPAGYTHIKQGPVHRDPEIAKLTCLEYYPEGMVDIKDDTCKVAAFLNPALPESRAYAMRFIREILTKYRFDGYALDYCRYPGAESDFSEASRQLFEKFIGAKVERFPDDIFTYNPDGTRNPGKWYKQWWEWRSGIIRDFVAEVRAAVDELQPSVKLQYWAGSWLHALYVNGQNWGSPRSDFSEAYLDDWATPTYRNTGFADQLDIFITGTYLEQVWGKDDPESIEFGIARSIRDTAGDCEVYGSLYARNHLDQFDDAVYLCLTQSAGVMVFDIVQVIQYDLWDDIRRGIDRAEAETKTEV